MLQKKISEKLFKLAGLLKKIHIIPLCLLAFIVKTLVITPNYAESIIVIALSALYGFWYLIEARRIPKPTQVMLTEISDIKNQVASIKMNMGLRGTANAETSQKRRF